MSDDGFYRDFEAAFRGSREEIRIRLKAYLPYVMPLLGADGLPRATLDLGCGRGEWVQLIGEAGFAARGVDLDDAMLAEAEAAGLEVRRQDAREALGAADEGSLALVTAFHLIEHLAFDDLRALVRMAHRALAPGGLMILETPNPENLDVATVTFHNDPTHTAPLPPNVTRFLAEHAGFAQVGLRRLNERPLVAGGAIALHDVIDQVSPDYAVIAQKDGPAPLMAVLRPHILEERGLHRHALSRRFEQRLALRDKVTDLELHLEAELHHLRRAHATLRDAHRTFARDMEATLAEARRRTPRGLWETWSGKAAATARTLMGGVRIGPVEAGNQDKSADAPRRSDADAATSPRAARDVAVETTRARQRPRQPFGALGENLSWQIEGPFDSSYSLAIVNRWLARALAAEGVSVRLVSAEGPGPFDANPGFLASNPDLAEMAAQGARGAVVSRNMYPPRVADIGPGLAGLHNYAWEETGLPEAYAEAFNAHLHFITVPSQHVRKVLIDNGVALPIAVVGNGIDHLDSAPPEPLPEGTLPPEVTDTTRLFVHVSSCFPRKGADVLLRAWADAFTGADDVALVVKTFDNPHNTIRQTLRLMEMDRHDMAPVRIVGGTWSEGQIRALYQAAHAAVFPSRAEGFCLPVAEAAREGCHVLATGWSGPRAFEGCPLVRFVDYGFAAADSHLGARHSVWAEPDRADLVRALKDLAATARASDAERDAARDWLSDRLTWGTVATRSVAAVRAAAMAEIRWPRIGWISTFNSRCGIATYSGHLIAHLGAPVHVLAPRGAAEIVPDGTLECPVTRCWTDDARDPLLGLHDTIAAHDFETVVIQFNYAFYDFESLGRLIHRLSDSGRQVVMTMHGTDDSRAPPDRQIADIRDALARCARLLVHKRVDLDRLKALGLVDNVTYFPHGILARREAEPAPRRRAARGAGAPAVTLGTYGFLLANKGLPELIDAVALLRAGGENVRLRMFNAEYPKDESRLERERCARRILDGGLAPFVDLDTRFRPDDAVLADLAACDLIVFPYQHSAESASGAVRYGLASGRPVAVTPLAIFSEVADVTATLPGTSAHDMARGLGALIARHRAGDAFSGMRRRAARHCADASYTRLGPRLHDMLISLSLNRQDRP